MRSSSRGKSQLVCLLGGLPRMKPAGLSTTSVAEWICRPAVYDRTPRPWSGRSSASSTYTADVDQFSADAAVAQLQLAAKGGVLYLHGGWQQLIDALAGPLDIRTGAEVLRRRPGRRRRRGAHRRGDDDRPTVVVATGGPGAIRRLLPADPGWGELGEPLTAACLDLGVNTIPEPGYVLSVDDPIYVTVQSPPARSAPTDRRWWPPSATAPAVPTEDRPQLERLVVGPAFGPNRW